MRKRHRKIKKEQESGLKALAKAQMRQKKTEQIKELSKAFKAQNFAEEKSPSKNDLFNDDIFTINPEEDSHDDHFYQNIESNIPILPDNDMKFMNLMPLPLRDTSAGIRN